MMDWGRPVGADLVSALVKYNAALLKDECAIKFNPDIHHRHSIRLKNYDYSSNGMYFVTICTQDRMPLFGEINVGADLVSALVKHNAAGIMVESTYKKIIDSFPNVMSDKFIVMPNHFHCIIVITEIDAATKRPETIINRADTKSAPTVTAATIGAIVQAFKSKTTVEYISGVKSGLYPPFNKRVWQRNYYEHIIRNESDYQKIWQYIDTNPSHWEQDRLYIV